MKRKASLYKVFWIIAMGLLMNCHHNHRDVSSNAEFYSPLDCDVYLYHQAVSDGWIIADTTVFWNERRDKITLGHLSSDSFWITLRYTRFMCSTCLDRLGQQLQNDPFLFRHSLLITDEADPAILEYYLHIKRVASICLASHSFSLPADLLQEPYIFVMKHGMVQSLIFPAHLPDNLVESYFRTLRHSLLEKKRRNKI